ncbi:hypothetical protein BDR03DRAFT_869673 [Suillus americanus]|nr:hypothetical protein BDR03DRAFT_869673 [Suillus americanus]
MRQFDSEDKITKVAQWLLLVNCLDDDGNLINTIPPSRTKLHNMEHCQCAHIETASRFSFSQTWTHDKVNQYLQNEVFPLAFGYVNSTEKGKGIGIPSFPWILISKERLRYDVVNIERPNGNDLA